MTGHLVRHRLAAVALIAPWLCTLLPAQATESWREMNRPAEPFRMIGNIYYVGASDIAVYLIPTDDGLILLDGGFPETVPLIRAGMEKLGYRLEDVKILLNSHAHIDHAGGLAELKRLTGARLLASRRDAPFLESGGRGDPLLGEAGRFPPVKVDTLLDDGAEVTLGGITLTLRLTPGHTPGCTTWVMNVTEGEEPHLAVFAGSLSILPGTRLLDEPTYPGIADDFARSIEVLRSIPADVFLASHASFFHLDAKRRRQQAGKSPNPFVDPEGYRAYVDRGAERLQARLQQERGGASNRR